MTTESTKYRLVNQETGEVIARGSKPDMKRLASQCEAECVIWFQGIPVAHLTRAPKGIPVEHLKVENELLHCRHGVPASRQHLCEPCMRAAAGY